MNLIYTLVQDPFAAWVKERVESRNLKLAEDNNMFIDLDPDIARAFNSSTEISRSASTNRTSMWLTLIVLFLCIAQKGVGAYLLTAGKKRRRTIVAGGNSLDREELLFGESLETARRIVELEEKLRISEEES